MEPCPTCRASQILAVGKSDSGAVPATADTESREHFDGSVLREAASLPHWDPCPVPRPIEDLGTGSTSEGDEMSEARDAKCFADGA